MPVSPRAFSALTILEPIKPTAPVTTIYMRTIQKCSPSSLAFEQFFRVNHRGAELAYDDSGRFVGELHGFSESGAGRQHHAQNGNDGVSPAADIVHFPCPSWPMQPLLVG